MLFKKIDLQIFAEGASGGDAGEGAGVATGVTGGEASKGEDIQIPSFIPEKAHKIYIESMKKNRSASSEGQMESESKQDFSTGNPTVEKKAEEKQEKKTFSQLIEDEEFKDEREAYMHNAFQRRFKDYDGLKNENASAKRVLSQMAKQFGVDENSKTFFEDLEKAQSNSVSEKRAKELSEKYDMPIEEARDIAAAESKIEQSEREKKAAEIARAELEQRQAQETLIRSLRESEEKTKKRFPEFDLGKAMQSEAFRKVCAACGGDTTAAYIATNHESIFQSVAKAAEDQASLKISNAVASNRSRAVENAAQNVAPASTETDFAKMSKKELNAWFENYRKRGRTP